LTITKLLIMKTGKKFLSHALTMSGFLLLFFCSCKKEYLPKIATTSVSKIKNISASSGGIISDEGVGTVIARGVCWSKNQNPTIKNNKTEDGPGGGSYSSNITGLESTTTYYARAYATNSDGTAYGEEQVFKTYQDYILDHDGNGYGTIIIEDQEWMAENLKTTTFNDGTEIPNISEDADWAETTAAAYCWYKNDKATYDTGFGALYNWHAVNTGNLCPVGWHVPTSVEWGELVNYIDPTASIYWSPVAGGKLKSTRTEPADNPRWDLPNTGATDEFGFSALPGGYRDIDGTFDGALYTCFLWSSSEESANMGMCRGMNNLQGDIGWSFLNKHDGFSVRCLKD
jgi:uncharacterized protein (TIGR02145 family)